MTIAEVEARTGLDRGTVRYYESEGLLKPERRPNGYRDYSQEDIERLDKIRLLRSVDFSVEDIRAMDRDGTDFADRLRARLRSLDAREADIGDARRVLERMLSDGAAYGQLDTALYLSVLEDRDSAPELPEATAPSIAPAPPAGEERWRVEAPEKPVIPEQEPEIGPWRRYFARQMDLSILSLAVLVVFQNVMRVRVVGSTSQGLLLTAAVALLCLLLEPLMITLLGLRVRANRLSSR